jgi:trans-aconitate methyltransferase
MARVNFPDRWSKAGAYESFMGRWSRELARRFVVSLAAPAGGRWLDLGCGTGALTAAILEEAKPAAVVACDPSQDFVAYLSAHQRDARLRVEAANLSTLPSGDSDFDVVASNLVMNFLPDPVAGLRDMYARTRANGVVAATVWDYASGMQCLRSFWDGARSVDPAAAALDEGERFPLCSPRRLVDAMNQAGLAEVAAGEIVVETVFSSFADYWTPFLEGVGPAGTYVAALDDHARDALAGAVRSRMHTEPSGAIAMTARAWTVRGRRAR